mgnify:CR=1 FL=1
MGLPELSHLIQLAVAPVFLLMGVGGFLNVMSGRLGRIIDRSRVVEQRSMRLKDPELLERNGHELNALRQRIRLNSWFLYALWPARLPAYYVAVRGEFLGFQYWRWGDRLVCTDHVVTGNGAGAFHSRDAAGNPVPAQVGGDARQ